MLTSTPMLGQRLINEFDYNQLKINNQIEFLEALDIVLSTNRASHRYTPLDSTYSLAIQPSDDGSSIPILLPFDFCSWGVPKNNVYINTNGNISFDQPFSSGTPVNMPFSNFSVIAPFWSDVDTRARGGVYYKLLHNALIIVWEDVGYYNQNDSKGNSFQLIITDGSSELLPFGYTVGFFYDQMEWTTGDGSGGLNGFGGAPAIIGINKGDGITSSKVGQYNRNDTTFWLSTDSLNGIKRIEEKVMYLNPCDSLNNKPTILAEKLKDTIGVCVGDTLKDSYYFYAPENDQLTFISADTSNFSGQKIENITSGEIASLDIEIIGSVGNIGIHSIPITVIDNGTPGHFYEINLIVQVDSLPEQAIIYGDTLICEYDTSQLTFVPVFDSYLWSTGDQTSWINAEPGIYTVTVGYNHCETEIEYELKANIPNANIIGEKYICLPDTLDLTVPANDSYLWSNGDTNNSIEIYQTGIYSVTVSNDGCDNSDSLNVKVFDNESLTISASNMNSCNGDSVSLSVTGVYDSVFWDTGDTLNMIKVSSGNYLVTALKYSGTGTVCIAKDSINVGSLVYPPISLLGDSIICGNQTTSYSVNAVFDSYLWDNGITTPNAVYVDHGIHSVGVTFGTCMDTLSFSIIKIDIPNLEILGNLFYCDTVDSSRLIVVGGIWDSLIWNTGETTDTIYTGYGWKKVTVWKDGCSAFEWHPVNELINGVDVEGITEICPGQSTQLKVELGFDFYQWSNGDVGFSSNINTPGSYWCEIHLGICNATTDTISVTLNIPDTVEILGDTVMCNTIGGFLYVDLGFSQFYWSTGETTPVISYTTPGVYSVTVEDDGYCIISDTIDVLVKAPIFPEIQGPSHYCFNDSVVLNINGFDHNIWSTNDTSDQIKVREGVYSVLVRNDDGCSARSPSFKVTSSSPNSEIKGDSLICENEMRFLSIEKKMNHIYEWSDGSNLDSIYVEVGQYQVSVTDTNGCMSVGYFDLKSNATPNAIIEVSPANISNAYIPINFYDGSSVSKGDIIAWFWNIDDSVYFEQEDIEVTFYTGTDLVITHVVWADNGCADTVILDYTISNEIVKTNVITPNGDGVNDYLEFPNIEKYTQNELTIYNRWGAIIFRTNNYRNYWDAYGVSEGVYFYTLSLGDGQSLVKGNFTIIK
jgi:gliding motility-associated-like protein